MTELIAIRLFHHFICSATREDKDTYRYSNITVQFTNSYTSTGRCLRYFLDSLGSYITERGKRLFFPSMEVTKLIKKDLLRIDYIGVGDRGPTVITKKGFEAMRDELQQIYNIPEEEKVIKVLQGDRYYDMVARIADMWEVLGDLVINSTVVKTTNTAPRVLLRK